MVSTVQARACELAEEQGAAAEARAQEHEAAATALRERVSELESEHATAAATSTVPESGEGHLVEAAAKAKLDLATLRHVAHADVVVCILSCG